MTIPKPATIDSAVVQLNAKETANDSMQSKLHAHAADSPSDFSSDATLNERTRTTASTVWAAVNTGLGWQTSPSIVAVIQEIVDRGGWSSGNALVVVAIVVATNPERPFVSESYDTHTSLAPKLDVDYTATGSGTPLHYYRRMRGAA